ncbi:hypothetical protein BESB_046600 [Besnoitia besnoiti]|uniref:Uncharacterized protein n=1 Tax=Besnoitia besnoiti TaxID=94643 RepID=A0A2A9MD94_BESBE|nr:hypothetical protein BESB_046600 [Besnoitia besnoiti]PFH36468.1 hypothetical protein BESB_046600 [Besnoitia besnoiti]
MAAPAHSSRGEPGRERDSFPLFFSGAHVREALSGGTPGADSLGEPFRGGTGLRAPESGGAGGQAGDNRADAEGRALRRRRTEETPRLEAGWRRQRRVVSLWVARSAAGWRAEGHL